MGGVIWQWVHSTSNPNKNPKLTPNSQPSQLPNFNHDSTKTIPASKIQDCITKVQNVEHEDHDTRAIDCLNLSPRATDLPDLEPNDTHEGLAFTNKEEDEDFGNPMIEEMQVFSKSITRKF